MKWCRDFQKNGKETYKISDFSKSSTIMVWECCMHHDVKICLCGYHLQWLLTPHCDSLSHWSWLNSHANMVQTNAHPQALLVSRSAHEEGCRRITGGASDPQHAHENRNDTHVRLPPSTPQCRRFKKQNFSLSPFSSLALVSLHPFPFPLHLCLFRTRAQWLHCL